MLDDIYRVFVTPRIKLKNLLVAVQWTTDACLVNRLEIEATINLSLATGYWLLATGYWHCSHPHFYTPSPVKSLDTNSDQNATKLTEKVCIIKKLSKLFGGVRPNTAAGEYPGQQKCWQTLWA